MGGESIDEHVMEALGRARVVVRDGKVVEVGEPLIDYCPIFHAALGIERITKEAVKENIEFRIREVGMFTPERKFETEKFVSFGTSESLMSCLEQGVLDAAITVCDGAGTVISADSQLVQAMGGKISGLVSTTPIPETICHIKSVGGYVLDEQHATIDPVEGLKRAVGLGYRRIGITVSTPEDARACRQIEMERGVKVVLFGVHLTGLSEEGAAVMGELLDVATGCASLHMRKEAGKRALLQAGASVPVFALTQAGKEVMLERLKDVLSPLLVSKGKTSHTGTHNSPRPLI
ncbi:MAG: methanogenesis marker 8 protein [Methermicoccaceae archaeon]